MNFQENIEDFENSEKQSQGAVLIQRIYARTSNFITALKDMQIQGETKKIKNEQGDPEPDSKYSNEFETEGEGIENSIRNYLDLAYVFGPDGNIKGAKYPIQIVLNSDSYESINSPQLPDLNEESSKSIIVVEFFTHCCINCIHSIEDLRQVYEKLTNKSRTTSICGLKFISIHSPKFTREKDSESIKAFTRRVKMDYSSVINDPECLLWKQLGICCWPTILVFGPNPQNTGLNLIFTLMGEGHKDVLLMLLMAALKYFDEKFIFNNGTLSICKNLNSTDQADFVVSTFLKYPGKVTCRDKLLGISDSGNNRIVISALNGVVKHVIGGISKGYEDGNFETARFYNPQGLVFYDDNLLYIADTGNHAIRKIDLTTKMVTTLIQSGHTTECGEESVVLKSPWDLVFFENVLLVAAAGNHRIFGYFFENMKLFNVLHQKSSFSVVAGSGKEENRNNSYIMKACFAQPSGICTSIASNDNDIGIFIADSESSSIRAITKAGKVMALVGGARDPTDLFAYGDTDGKGFDAKMQHPMGVSWSSKASTLFAVDTYNHKVKAISIGSKDKNCYTIIGDGISGNELGKFNTIINEDVSSFARLNEPAGICCDDMNGLLYIADTNNHSIKVANLSQETVNVLTLIMDDKPSESVTKEASNLWNEIFDVPVYALDKNLDLQVLIYNIPKEFEGGQWSLQGNGTFQTCSGEVQKDEDDIGKFNIAIPCLNDNKQFKLNVDIFVCGVSSCYKRTMKFLINVFESICREKSESETKLLVYRPSTDFFL